MLYQQSYLTSGFSQGFNKKAEEILGELEFVVGLGNAESCDLILQNAKINGGQADIGLINGKFKLLGICPEGGARSINPLSKAGITKIAQTLQRIM